MNERIRELEAQCWEPRQYGPAWFNSTKFARLIVQECMTVADLPNSADGKYDAFLPSEMIAKHFGANDAMES